MCAAKGTSMYYVITKGITFSTESNHKGGEGGVGGSENTKSWLRNTWMVPNIESNCVLIFCFISALSWAAESSSSADQATLSWIKLKSWVNKLTWLLETQLHFGSCWWKWTKIQQASFECKWDLVSLIYAIHWHLRYSLLFYNGKFDILYPNLAWLNKLEKMYCNFWMIFDILDSINIKMILWKFQPFLCNFLLIYSHNYLEYWSRVGSRVTISSYIQPHNLSKIWIWGEGFFTL